MYAHYSTVYSKCTRRPEERVRRGDSGSARAAGSAEEEEVYSALTSASLSPLLARALPSLHHLFSLPVSFGFAHSTRSAYAAARGVHFASRATLFHSPQSLVAFHIHFTILLYEYCTLPAHIIDAVLYSQSSRLNSDFTTQHNS